MQFPSSMRIWNFVGLALFILGAACQESKGRKFEQGSVSRPYSTSEINEEIDLIFGTDEFLNAIDVVANLTPSEFIEQTYAGFTAGPVEIDGITFNVSEDDIAEVKETYKELNLEFSSMGQAWESVGFDLHALDSDDFKEALSGLFDYIVFDSITGFDNETDEEIPDSLSLQGGFQEYGAFLETCSKLLECRDPQKAWANGKDPKFWDALSNKQTMAGVAAVTQTATEHYFDSPTAGKFAAGAVNTLSACAPTVGRFVKYCVEELASPEFFELRT